jgi:hypothetical protein
MLSVLACRRRCRWQPTRKSFWGFKFQSSNGAASRIDDPTAQLQACQCPISAYKMHAYRPGWVCQERLLQGTQPPTFCCGSVRLPRLTFRVVPCHAVPYHATFKFGPSYIYQVTQLLKHERAPRTMVDLRTQGRA